MGAQIWPVILITLLKSLLISIYYRCAQAIFRNVFPVEMLHIGTLIVYLIYLIYNNNVYLEFDLLPAEREGPDLHFTDLAHDGKYYPDNWKKRQTPIHRESGIKY